jgi:hypothetical protein
VSSCEICFTAASRSALTASGSLAAVSARLAAASETRVVSSRAPEIAGSWVSRSVSSSAWVGRISGRRCT